jgi:hypothetical protein
MPFETEKDLLPLLANTGGWVYNPKASPHPHARTTIRLCNGEAFFMAHVLTSLLQLKDGCLDALSSRLARWTKPLGTSLPMATLADLGRSKSELIAENALLRKPLIVLRRQVKRPTFSRIDRILLVLLARLVRTWQQAFLIVQPDTLLRWHRELFRLFWKRRSKTASHNPKVAAETIALIRQMARENRLWGAERIRGERAFAEHTGVQAHHPEVHEDSSHPAATRSEVVDLSAHARRPDLGVRLLTSHRFVLSPALCLLPH